MKLISDIINDLVDAEKSITSPLLKTKVLASRLQHAQMIAWVGKELKGYGNENLPIYRIYQGNIVGTYTNFNIQYNDQPVPTIGLDKKLEEIIRKFKFNQSISSLEAMVEKDKTGSLEAMLPAELVGIIQQNWRKMGNPYIQLVNCKKLVNANVINDILSYVRNNLLDLMLKIDSEFGGNTEIEDLKNKKTKISTIMNQTIINTSGDGNIVNSGHEAQISANLSVTKKNKSDLLNYLKGLDVSETDRSLLANIIEEEEPDYNNKTFGKKVNGWIKNMIGQSLDGSWNIAIGTAGNLLSEAIKSYYGM